MIKKEIYRAAYVFHDKWSPYPKTPDEWLLATREMKELTAFFHDNLLNGFLLAIFEDFEHEYRKCTQENN